MCELIPPTCEEHEIINSSNMCVDRTAENCGNGEVFSPVNTGGVCISAAEVLATVPFISPTYTAASCENARWETGFAFSGNKQEVAEVCEIPVMRNDTAAARESQPQIANGTSINGCIMRQSAGFSAENMPNCENPQLFGNGRFPVRPANFNPGDILTLTDGELSFNGVALRSESPQTQTSGGNGSGSSFIFSGIGLFWAIYSWQVGSGEFNFSPDVGYSLTESGYSANAAGQLNFRDENLHIYWRAGQQNSETAISAICVTNPAENMPPIFGVRLLRKQLPAKRRVMIFPFPPIYEAESGKSPRLTECNPNGKNPIPA